jgi:hypothetical protein
LLQKKTLSLKIGRMKKFLILIFIIHNALNLFAAATSVTNVDECRPSTGALPPVPVYRVNGITDAGLAIDGMVVFSCHVTPSRFYLPPIEKFAAQARHFIIESDPYSHRTSPSYHGDDEFLKHGIICRQGNIAELAAKVGAPFNELLKDFPPESTPLIALPWLWLSISWGFVDDHCVDMWASGQAKIKKTSLISLEDMCDRVHSKEPAMQTFPEEYNEFGIESWIKLVKEFYTFTQSLTYLQYKEKMTKLVHGQKVELTAMPQLLYYPEQDNPFKIEFKEVEKLVLEETMEEMGRCGRVLFNISTEAPMIYRNRLWLARLKDRILPGIKGEPFILVVGVDHAHVTSDAGENLGVLDFFEGLVGKKNVQLV